MSTAATCVTSSQILNNTTTFLSQILAQSDLRHRLLRLFTENLPTPLSKSLNFASQTIENAISTTSLPIRSSSLLLAEKIISSAATKTDPFSLFLLSLIHLLSQRPVEASTCLLDVFHADPSLCRREIAPSLFQEMFIVHFLPILQWHDERRSGILSSPSIYAQNNEAASTVLSRMNGDQASALKDLERDYERLLDDNCRIFVQYFKEILRNGDEERMISTPCIEWRELELSRRTVAVEPSEEEEEMKSLEFGSNNRRYNPIWAADGDDSVEFNDGTKKSISRFPSFFPERVSPYVFSNQSSSFKPSPLADNNASHSFSSQDSPETEFIQEKLKTSVLLDSGQPQPAKKEKQHLSDEQETTRSPYSWMEDADKSPAGKYTPPKDFVCPITTHIFDDPVTLETGQTYERRAIQEWFDTGHSTCPITRQKLHTGTLLPKTNYVLKRLIASWKEQNPVQETGGRELFQNPNEPVTKPLACSSSPISVISQATIEAIMSELRVAITDLCTSEALRNSETAVLKIERCWNEANAEPEMVSMLSRPAVVNGFVEVLFNSVDSHVLRAAVVLLTELGSRDESVVQTLTRVDSDMECIVELFKKGLVEALGLVQVLNPPASSLLEMDILDYLLELLEGVDEDSHDVQKTFLRPKSAAVIILGSILKILGGGSARTDLVKSIISTRVIEEVILSLQSENVEEKIAAVSVLLRCMLEDGKCRNAIAYKAELASVLRIFVEVNDDTRLEMVHFLSQLVKLNRRSLNEKILCKLKQEGKFSTMHTLLIYLQNTLDIQSPITAGLLLQLDLLDEPKKMSIYREEAMDILISCLRNSESPVTQISAAETLLSLQGRFSYSGKSLAKALLLKRAGLDRSYKSFIEKDQRRHKVFEESQDKIEEEKAAEDWERRVASVLISHEFGLVFEALSEGLKSKYEDLRSICLMTSSWLVYMLSNLPDTGIQGAARICLLKQFVSIIKNGKNDEDRILSMIALNSFIREPEGLHDLSVHMKDILKGLRDLRRCSNMAVEMLKNFSGKHDTSADLWNHRELNDEDCSVNGEVLAITCCKGRICSGHSDGAIKVWSIKDSKLYLIQEIREHTKPVTSLAILQSSEKLYSGSLDRTVRVWSIAEKDIDIEQVHEFKDQINNLVVANCIACYIPQGSGVKVHSWNGYSKLLNQHKNAKCLALVQGKLYCGCHDNSIQEIDLVSGTSGNIQSGAKKLLGKTHPINALQVYDGLLYAACSSFDGTNIKIWSTSNYNLVGLLQSTSEVRTISISSELIYLGCKGGMIEVWCKNKLKRIETLQTSSTAKILCSAIDADEDTLVIGTSDGRIQTWAPS